MPLSAQDVAVRVGSHPGYGRMVFEWPARPDYRVETEGSQVVLHFPQGAALDLGTASSRLPRNVVSVAADDGGVRVGVRPGARVRHFNHGSKVVLDVLDPPPASDAAAGDPAGDIAALAATPVVDAAAGRVQAPDTASPVVVASTDLRGVLAAAPFARSGGVPASDNPSPSAALAQAALPPAGNPFPPSPMPSVGGAQPAQAQAPRPVPQTVPLTIEQGSGRLVQLSAPALTILAADPRIARVQPASPTSLFIMGVNAGRTNIIATAEDGSPVAEFEVTVQATRTTNSDVSAVVPSAPAAPPLNAGEVQSTIRRLVRGAESVRVSNLGRNGLALRGCLETPSI